MPADDHPSTPNRFVVFVGGDAPARTEAGHPGRAVGSTVEDVGSGRERGDRSDGAKPTDVTIAVDSGLHLAQLLALRIDHVVGDMDSVDPAALAAAEASGAALHVHQADKDATDLELALDLVLSLWSDGAQVPQVPRLHVVGGGGGRLDHLLGDLLMLSAPRLAGWDVTARLGAAAVAVARSGRSILLTGVPGEQVSLLPVHGDARGVTTHGLRWPLVDGHLAAGTSRGISNELSDPEASVAVAAGTLAVVQPGTRSAVTRSRAGTYDPTPRAPEPMNQETAP